MEAAEELSLTDEAELEGAGAEYAAWVTASALEL